MKDKNPWWKQYCFPSILFLIFLLLAFALNFYIKTPYNLLLTSILLGYGAFGALRFILASEIMKYVWDRTKVSQEESKNIAKKLYKEKIDNLSLALDNKIREPFKWAPRSIGVLEGIIYTSAVVFNQLGLIALWLTFKAIGEWNDSKETGPTRIRANNFVIGNGISLITGIIGGIIFWLFYNSGVIVKSIDNAYRVIK